MVFSLVVDFFFVSFGWSLDELHEPCSNVKILERSWRSEGCKGERLWGDFIMSLSQKTQKTQRLHLLQKLIL